MCGRSGSAKDDPWHGCPKVDGPFWAVPSVMAFPMNGLGRRWGGLEQKCLVLIDRARLFRVLMCPSREGVCAGVGELMLAHVKRKCT